MMNGKNMKVLSKKFINRYVTYDVTIELEKKLHFIRVSVVNDFDFNFVRMGAGCHESIDHDVFENIKSMIKEYFLEEQGEN